MRWKAGGASGSVSIDAASADSVVIASDSSFPAQHRHRLFLEVEVGLARDVEDHLLDRAAGEGPGPVAGIVDDA
jgi:hypothetical protein